MSTLEERIANLSPEKRQRLLAQLKQQSRPLAPTPPPAIQPLDRAAGPLPLSSGQQRLWFLDQFEPGNPVYNLPMALSLEGKIDFAILERSLSEIVRRHEVLRTSYRDADGHPELQIQTCWQFQLIVTDVCELSHAELAHIEEQWMREEAQRPFDLSRDILLRAAVLREAEHRAILLLTMHHIVGDAWSWGVLLHELGNLYQAFLAGAPSPLPALPVQYVDYANWQRHTLTGQTLAEQLDYWKERLAGMPTTVELPTDHLRPPILTYRGQVLYVNVPRALTDALRALSTRANVTFFMTLLTAFQLLLARYTGQDDIVVGSPIANRTQAEIENLIGFFVNTLVLRTTFDPAWTFQDALKKTREGALGAYAHQALPFEQLVEALQPERDPSHNPLFQVLFALQNTPAQSIQIADVTMVPREIPTTTAKFDLSLYLWETEEGLTGMLEYSTDLFERTTIERFFTHFQKLLEGIVHNPEQRLFDLPLLSAAERDQLMNAWNDTATEYSRERLIPDLIAEQARRTPENTAVVFQSQRLTYWELEERANQLAHYLQALGIGPESLVGICVERSLEMVIGVLGILKAGGAYIPLDPALPADRLSYMLEDALTHAESHPPVLVTQSAVRQHLPSFSGTFVCLDSDRQQIDQMPTTSPPQTATANNLMYVIYTSGSTGKPKGVQIPQRAVLNFMESMQQQPGITADDVLISVTTLSFDIAALEIYLPLLVGAQVVVVSREVATDGPELMEVMATSGVTLMQATPATWRLLVESGWQGKNNLKVLCGGEALTRELASALLQRCSSLWNLYGPTETTIWSCRHCVQASDLERPIITIGRPLANTQLYVLDAQQQLVPPGVTGELYIGGDGLARGYLHRPDLTREKFVTNPFDPSGTTRLYRTGDVVRYRPDGTLEFVGRSDHQVKMRGFRIELGEIDASLLQAPGVGKAVTIVREDQPGDKRLVAYLIPAADHALNLAEVRGYLKTFLPDYMVPGAFVVLDTFPLTPNGKLDRRALPLPATTRSTAEEQFVAPRNEQEQRMAAIWSEVLGVDRIGIDDNFFDLGGESFKAVRAVRKIGTSLSVMDLFRHPTIRQLAESMAGEKTQQPQGLLQELTPPVDTNKRTLSLVCIPFAGGNPIMYQPMAQVMPATISLFAVEIPGHDFSRSDEPLEPLSVLAARCVQEIQERISGPLALFGHCLGSALTIEIARQLEHAQVSLTGIFIAGNFPSPRMPGRLFEWSRRLFPVERWTARRTALDFLHAMGFFTEVTDPAEQAFVVHNFLSEASEVNDYYTEAYQKTAPRLQAPLVCIVGQMDRATELYEERYKEWEFFSHEVSLAVIPNAGHYFPKHQASEVVDVVKEQIAQWQHAPAAPHALPTHPQKEVTRTQPSPLAVRRPARKPGLPGFFTVAIGQLVSLIGTGLTTFALGVWVYQKTGSITSFAFVAVFALLPAIAIAPIGGTLADRYDRKKIMLACDTMTGAISATIAVLLGTNSLQLWQVYVLACLAAMTTAFHQPAYLAAVTQLVPKRYYGRANGIVQIGAGAGALLAPLLGGLLSALIGLSGIVVIDLLTFLFAVTATLLVRFPNSLWRMQEEPFLKEVLGGWQYIWKRQGLVAIILFTTGVNYLFAMMDVLVTPLVLSFGNATVLGTVLAANGTGVLTGSILMSLWGGTRRRVNGIIGAVILAGLSTAIIGVRAQAVFPMLGLFGIGFAFALLNAHWLSVVQTKVGLELQARVMSTNLMMVWAMTPLGYITAGPLADHIFKPIAENQASPLVQLLVGTGPGRGIGLMLVLAGLLVVVWAVLAYRYRPIRHLEDAMPDVFADAVIEMDKDILQQRADQLLAEQADKQKVVAN
ncbi:MAG TPA: amino acid adenylation domain-containing protein [Ktedonobacteraceae bacterium]|nr:amino acid adenylation domain-containing protein [Ktedonobacteraceae bacterium]